MPVLIFHPDTSPILEVEDLLAFLESNDERNNQKDSADELTFVANQAGTPNVTIEGVTYLPNRQNSENGWVFTSGTDHLALSSSVEQDNFDSGGCYVAVAFKADDLGTGTNINGDLFPRLWALSDTMYLHLQAGVDATAHKLGFYRRFSIGDLNYVTQDDVIIDGQAHIVEVLFDSASASNVPTVRVDGTVISSWTSTNGLGTAEAVTGKPFHIGNRQEDEFGGDVLSRGFSGDIYAFVAVGQTPTLVEQNDILGTLSNNWDITVADPFNSSISDQTLNVVELSGEGTSVDTPLATNIGTSPTWSMSGDLTTYYSISSFTGLISVKAGATAPALNTLTSGTVTVDNGVDTDEATITIRTVAAGTVTVLKYNPDDPDPVEAAKYDWTKNIARQVDITQTPDRVFRPSEDGEDIVILGGNSPVSATSFQIRSADGGTKKFRHVVIKGGHYTGTTTTSSGTEAAVWLIREFTGNLWVEGVAVVGGERQDGFQIGVSGTNSGDCYFQRCWFEHIGGPRPFPHGDFIQSRGPIKDVYVDMFYGQTGYQGFFFDSPNSGASNTGVTITNGDVRREDNTQANGSVWEPLENPDPDEDVGGYVFWVENDYLNGCTIGDATSRLVDSVWCEEYKGQLPQTMPKPPSDRFIWIDNGKVDEGSSPDANSFIDGGERYLVPKSGVDGFINVGLRTGPNDPGDNALLTKHVDGDKIVRRSTGELYGGVNYA